MVTAMWQRNDRCRIPLKGAQSRQRGKLGWQARAGGFSLIEMMVSLTLFLLGVVTAGGAMVVTEQSAQAMEERYLDYAELRNHIEELKSKASRDYPGGVSADGTMNVATSINLNGMRGSSGSARIELGAAGLPNLIRVEMTAVRNRDEPPVTIVTYVRAVD